METQDPKYCLEEFRVFKVDENNIRMSEFIKRKIKPLKFENGKAFYEFKQLEDLQYYKEVIHVPLDVYTKRMKVTLADGTMQNA